MDPKILLWNVRGMGNRDKRTTILQNIGSSSSDIFCIQEIKIQLMTESFVKEVWGPRPCGWLALPSWGASGGILVIWDVDRIEVLEHILGAFSVLVRCRVKVMLNEWVFVGVYGPNLRTEVSNFL